MRRKTAHWYSAMSIFRTEQPASSVMSVALARGENALSEVVVVGYGTRLRRDVTSSISKVTNRDFQNLPLPSFEQALQGRAAGVFINSGSGKLGQGLTIRVRGVSSISANQQPFVVIDGVPAVSQALGSYSEPDNPLATLNPDDIESIEVLKDAASAAIYGARASNGVILVDWQNLEEDQFYAKATETGATYNGLASNYSTKASTWNVRNYLNFSQNFGDKHEFSGVTGIEYQEYNTRANGVQGASLPNDRFKKIASAAKIVYGNSTEDNSSFASYFLRGNYKFNNRYLLQASARVDGSSRFAKDKQYGWFPSVSAGWILSEENFLKGSNALSFLKLRAGYGRTGNAEIGNFAYRTLWSAAFYADQAGIAPTQIGRDDLRWETSDQIDIGLDFALIKNRINIETDYYIKKTKDLLLDFQLPTQNGFGIVTKNIGKMENRGWELTVSSRNLTGAFKWNTSFNISAYKNKVTDMGGSVLNGGSRQLGRVEAGKPFGYFYGPKYLGVDPDNGDALYADLTGKPTNNPLAAADFEIGNPHPDFYGGLNNNFSYKGFELDIQTQFVSGNDIYNIAGFFQSVNGDFYDNQSKDQMRYWRKPGDVTDVPQPRFLDGNGGIKSSRWVQDGSYLRVKSVSLAYNLSRGVLQNLRIDNARIYMAANNLFTFTDYDGYDPEVNATYVGNVNLGHDFYTPPQARTITIGISIGL
jgi:TonB-linked SusC/RagA family outer membrane protein